LGNLERSPINFFSGERPSLSLPVQLGDSLARSIDGRLHSGFCGCDFTGTRLLLQLSLQIPDHLNGLGPLMLA
jgi:hypothetical protein